MKIDGGCLCGDLRYLIDAALIDAGFCHCSICQKSSGAPSMAWFTIPFNRFRYSRGNATVFQSSEHYQREFCSGCGTQIAFRSVVNPKTIDVTICSLDDSSAIKPNITYGAKVR